MTRRLLLTMALVSGLVTFAGAQLPAYRARLAMVPTDLAMQATIAGMGSATATLKGASLAITGTFTGLKTPATLARVHRSAKPGMRGAPIGDLTVTQETHGTISGTIELSKEQIEDLAAGRLYLQLHSQKAPDGNLWGWFFVERK